jgi:hypothetical protein
VQTGEGRNGGDLPVSVMGRKWKTKGQSARTACFKPRVPMAKLATMFLNTRSCLTTRMEMRCRGPRHSCRGSKGHSSLLRLERSQLPGASNQGANAAGASCGSTPASGRVGRVAMGTAAAQAKRDSNSEGQTPFAVSGKRQCMQHESNRCDLWRVVPVPDDFVEITSLRTRRSSSARVGSERYCLWRV